MKYCGYCGSAIADNEKNCPVCKEEQDSMSYTEAITMVKNGDQKGFVYLYNTTYSRNKWELSKILGNEDDAEDVLQNAYIKMMGKIDMLQDPEKFPGWFGRMATNMAIDLYRAQHPKRKDSADENDTYRRTVSFSELEYQNDEGEVTDYEWEDEKSDWKPEVSYTQKETQELVQAMMSNLSDEQRMCLMLYHIEGMSIKEIADMMEVSENTVKSRLNYARKNIKEQGEELQKKGYQLYSYAPLPLLLYLLRMQANAASSAQATVSATTAMQVWQQICTDTASETAVQSVAQTAVKEVGKKATTKFVETVIGKITVGVAATALVAGGVIALVQVNKKEVVPETVIVQTDVVQTVADKSKDIAAAGTTVVEETIAKKANMEKLYKEYLKDVLIPQYGLFPEYQSNANSDAQHTGILCSDIDDYDADGFPDLFVAYNDNEHREKEVAQLRALSFDCHVAFFSVQEDKVVLVDEMVKTQWSYVMPYAHGAAGKCGRHDFMWKVSAGEKIYLVAGASQNMHGGLAPIRVMEYANNKIQEVRSVSALGDYCFGYEYVDGKESKRRLLLPDPTGTMNGTPENITAEEFFAELGIDCVIDRSRSGRVSFGNEHKTMYEVYMGAKEDMNDISFHAVMNHIEY